MFLSFLAASLVTTAALARDSPPAAFDAYVIDRRDGDLLDKYRSQVTKLDDQISGATQCYTDYLDKVKTPGSTPLDDIETCHEKLDVVRADLGTAHETARNPNFPEGELFRAQLPDVLDSRSSLQGQWTKDLQDRLQQLTHESVNAFEAQKRAELLPQYGEQVAALYGHLSEAFNCYGKYLNESKQPEAVPDSIDACDKENDAAGLALADARKMAYQPDFPDDNWLFRANLPDMRDGRTENQGEWTKGLQTKLDELRDAAKQAWETKQQADITLPYQKLVTDLYLRIANATKCYTDYFDKIQQDGITDEGPDSGAIDACHEDYDKTQEMLREARKTADQPNFPGGNWLFHSELPDMRDGRTEHQGEWTKDLQTKLDNLLLSAKRGHEAGVKADDDMHQFNATIFQEVVPELNKTIFEKAEALVKYVGLQTLMQGKPAEEARMAANKALVNYLAEIKDPKKMVDSVFEIFSSEKQTE